MYNIVNGGDMNNLKKYRVKAKITAENLAKKVGITKPYVYMLENGTSDPTLKLAYKIADTLKKSVLTIWPKN
jgi:putative transcriptional regulator